jgi:uncharacterized protein YodC (DUF2158 family)
MAETFIVGEKARLRSGGPIMTVTKVGNAAMTEAPTVWCSWFVGTKLESGTFPPEALEKVT